MVENSHFIAVYFILVKPNQIFNFILDFAAKLLVCEFNAETIYFVGFAGLKHLSE